ncbi:purine nucleoside permease [Xylogone sp. PMI_703]|nr:purine nucleoside permease [Xylogone sp. PMI_703]
MHFSHILSVALAATSVVASSARVRGRGASPASVTTKRRTVGNLKRQEVKEVISPKLFIISMFDSEADVWYDDAQNQLGLLDQNFTIPGFSPLFPDAHCTASGDICQLTTGEGESNAATTVTALMLSPQFNLTSTYFLITGIAGGNPHVVTTGSVTFARYAIQFDLQYEFDPRQMPSNMSWTGYMPQGGVSPDTPNTIDYPTSVYGTEVFELNVNLLERAYYIASLATLNDTDAAAKYRANYGYAPANQPPSVVKCDSGTSNVYWSGSTLGDAFQNYTLLMTNGTGVYCASQQEDNATLEALLRGALSGLLDFSRIILMRTISDFDRAPPNEDEVFHLLKAQQEGFDVSIENIYQAGIEIVKDIRMYWNGTYAKGLEPGNYIGDLFNSLGGEPDVGIERFYIPSE